MHKSYNPYLFGVMIVGLAIALSPGLALAGSLDPPPEAVDGIGDSVGTEHPLEEFIVGDRDVDPAARFSLVLGGAGVLDARTTLVWEQSTSTTERSQADSILYCNDLDLGGQTDWRLPEVQELLSLVDYENSVPALPTGHPFSIVDPVFDPDNFTFEPSPYWTATSSFVLGPNDEATAWTVQFQFGFSGPALDIMGLFAWCVR